jgi:UMF1 family MFS transporter
MFWLAGIMIGIFSGPNQSASRSLMARFIPKNKENEFFGFFAFSGKATAFMGPFLLGICTELFGSQRFGVGIVGVFLIIGAILLNRVKETEGIAVASKESLSVSI